MDRSEIKVLSDLGNRVKDSLIRRDVSEGRDGPLLSPGVGHNLKIDSDKDPQCVGMCQSLIK